MPRILRTSLPDGFFHVTAHAVFAQMLFLDDADRTLFLELLAETIHRYRWNCHAYCLMGTHYHLVVDCTRADLSDGMQWLNGVYAQRFNDRHKPRFGHLSAPASTPASSTPTSSTRRPWRTS